LPIARLGFFEALEEELQLAVAADEGRQPALGLDV
jgi:hypothetical protein